MCFIVVPVIKERISSFKKFNSYDKNCALTLFSFKQNIITSFPANTFFFNIVEVLANPLGVTSDPGNNKELLGIKIPSFLFKKCIAFFCTG